VFSLMALLTVGEGGGGRITAVTLIVMAAAVIFVAGRLRYPELDEIKAGIKRMIGDRRVRVANHVRVRRACRMMGQAQNVGAIFAAARELLNSAEFVYATIELGCGNPAANRKALDRGNQPHGAQLRDGIIHWQWERGDVEGHEIVDSHLFWNIRLPLSSTRDWGAITFYREFGGDELLLDINYLINLVQRELTTSVERVFTVELKPEVITLSGERKIRTLAAKA
jgi:hypothetical protein